MTNKPPNDIPANVKDQEKTYELIGTLLFICVSESLFIRDE